MDFIWSFHSYMRFAILLMGVISVILSGYYAIQRALMPQGAKTFIKAYVYVLTFQVAIGILQLLVMWNEYQGALRHRLEHATIMIVTLGVAHYGLKFLRSTAPSAPRNAAIVMAGILVLILCGILLLPQGLKVLGLA